MLKAMQKTSLIDYPGKIVTTVFFDGCNFRCPFCHNKDLVLPELIADSEDDNKIKISDVIAHLKNNREFLDGICITGGEPTLSLDLVDLIKQVKNLRMVVKLDSNGTNPLLLKKLIEDKLVDYIAMDIKGPFENYDKFCGVKTDINKIKESVELIKNSEVEYEFRTTVMPKLFNKDIIIKTVKQLNGCKLYSLQKFRAGNTLSTDFEAAESFSKEELEEIKEEILRLELAKKCIVRA